MRVGVGLHTVGNVQHYDELLVCRGLSARISFSNKKIFRLAFKFLKTFRYTKFGIGLDSPGRDVKFSKSGCSLIT